MPESPITQYKAAWDFAERQVAATTRARRITFPSTRVRESGITRENHGPIGPEGS